MRPILLAPLSVNQSAPSDPLVILNGWLAAVGSANSVMAPEVVMRPILLLCSSVNQRAPSGPAIMPSGRQAICCGNGIFRDCAASGDAPDLVDRTFGKPERAVRPGGYTQRTTNSRPGKLDHISAGRNAPNFIAREIGKPEGAIRPLNKVICVGGRSKWKQGYNSL